jgi:hypothetical protein
MHISMNSRHTDITVTRGGFPREVAVLCMVVLFAASLHAQNASPFETERLHGSEQALDLRIEAGYARVLVRRDTRDRLYSVTAINGTSTRYEQRGGEAVVLIDLSDAADDDGLQALSRMFGKGSAPKWEITISDRIPLRLRFELGAGNADLDVTGLRLRQLAVESGAGNVRLRAAEPNMEPLRSVSIESGIGSFQSQSLGNLGFETLRFEGGMGSYALDLSGAVRSGATVMTDVGMGSLVLTLPSGVGVTVRNEASWFTSSRLEGLVQTGKARYESVDAQYAQRRMLVRMNAGMGSVRVQWK